MSPGGLSFTEGKQRMSGWLGGRGRQDGKGEEEPKGEQGGEIAVGM